MEHEYGMRGADVQALLARLGTQLKQAAKKAGSIQRLAQHAGVPRSTLYRLFAGEVVGTDSLLRVLRALDRWDVIFALLAPPNDTPIEIWSRRQDSKPGRRKPGRKKKSGGATAAAVDETRVAAEDVAPTLTDAQAIRQRFSVDRDDG